MFTVSFRTDSTARQIDATEALAGPALAALLREAADLVEQDYQILPWPGGEWITERRTVALRGGAQGPIVNAVLTLAHD